MGMFTTDPKLLETIRAPYRLWQGIPSMDITKNGRKFYCWYSGMATEDIGNYAMLFTDDGDSIRMIGAAMPPSGFRCFDPCVWVDPLHRLWFLWAKYPDDGLYAVICEDPDAEELHFGEEFFVGNNVMMNKPTVLSTGEWVFPVAIWKEGINTLQIPDSTPISKPRLAYALVSDDAGKTFTARGGVDLPDRSFDEHMFLERRDGVLTVYVRTFYGIGMANSYDYGFHWSEGRNSGIAAPGSRFHIRRLPSGRILLVNHLPGLDGAIHRSRLAAMLSEDDGKTWPYRLMLDERKRVSYPDCAVASDGSIYIIYDHERGSTSKSLAEAYTQAREILLAHITEEDILCGAVTAEGSFLQKTVSKLGKYAMETAPQYAEAARHSASNAAKALLKEKTPTDALKQLFHTERIPSSRFCRTDYEKLDRLCDAFCRQPTEQAMVQLILAIRLSSGKDVCDNVIEDVIQYIDGHLSENLSLESLSKKFYISKYYLAHLFKHETGLSVLQFCVERRILRACRLLRTDLTMAQICEECGFSSQNYFAAVFKKQTGKTPRQYRKGLQTLSC